MRRWVGSALAGLLAVAGMAAGAQGPALLGKVAAGEWRLRDAGDGSVRDMCVTRPMQLFQLRSGAGACRRVVLDNGARSATVSYSCSAGAGRTTLTLAGDGALHIETQGLAGGEPFDSVYDARLMGRCA